jgi:hypothetical protein
LGLIAILRLLRDRHTLHAVSGDEDRHAVPRSKQPIQETLPQGDSPAANDPAARGFSADADFQVMFHSSGFLS